jgi:hypothetical protein
MEGFMIRLPDWLEAYITEVYVMEPRRRKFTLAAVFDGGDARR